MPRAFLAAIALWAVVLAQPAAAEPRTALVIGNGAYAYGALANAVNDAADVADVLGKAGFEVIHATDADHRAMDEAIDAFAARLKEKGGVGLFYFSGHGVRVGGDNYLLPIGEELTHERDVKYEAVNAGQVIDAMAAAGNGLNIVVLDACRNNPLLSSGRTATRGLTRLQSGAGTFISFSTAPGEVALDGEGRNSPFTRHLVQAIATPGLSLEQTFKETLKGVHVETDGRQTPWVSSSFFGDFVFQPAEGGAAAETQGRPAAPQQAALVGPPSLPAVATHSLAGLYRAKGTNPDGSSYSGMVAITEDGGAHDFTWWIGKDVFRGHGPREGRWLRIDWGQASPVIYTQGADGVLDGMWADGSATETLAPYALAAEGVRTLAGDYRVKGRNPDGSTYSGGVRIAGQGPDYQVHWSIGSSSYAGTGRIADNVLVVDWGADTPAVYAVGADGALTGLWDTGSGSEVLTPLR